MKIKRLSYPAPSRLSIPSEQPDLWCSVPWTAAAVNEVLSAGGWFAKGRHTFENALAARLAGCE